MSDQENQSPRVPYGLIESGVLVQKQYKPQEGFVEIPDSAVCGMLWNGNNFSAPPASPKEESDIAEVERVILIRRDENGEITHRVPVMLDATGALVQGEDLES